MRPCRSSPSRPQPTGISQKYINSPQRWGSVRPDRGAPVCAPARWHRLLGRGQMINLAASPKQIEPSEFLPRARTERGAPALDRHIVAVRELDGVDRLLCERGVGWAPPGCRPEHLECLVGKPGIPAMCPTLLPERGEQLVGRIEVSGRRHVQRRVRHDAIHLFIITGHDRFESMGTNDMCNAGLSHRTPIRDQREPRRLGAAIVARSPDRALPGRNVSHEKGVIRSS
jgi:hypothetical protein